MLAVCAGAGIVLYKPRAEAAARAAATADLGRRAEFIASSGDRWVSVALADARLVASYPSVLALAGGTAPDAASHLQGILSSFAEVEAYDRVIVEQDGRVLMMTGTAPLSPGCLPDARTGGAPPLHLHGHAVVARFQAPIPGTRAVVVLEQAADDYLRPLTSRGTPPFDSAESLLVAFDGRALRVLSPPKFVQAPPLSVAQPMARDTWRRLTTGAAQDAVADYRGVPVLAAARPLSAAPWAVLVKVDEADVLAAPRAAIGANITAWTAVAVAVTLGTLGLVLIERRRLDASLSQSRARLSEVLDQANDAVMLVDATGRIVDANRRASEFYGYGHEALVGQSVFHLRAPHEREEARRRIDEALTTGRALFEAEHQRADGSRVPVEVNVRRIDLDGSPGFVTVVRDLSDRRRSQQRMERLARLQLARARINEGIARGDGAAALLDGACRVATARPGLRLAWIGFAESDGTVRLAARAGEASRYADGVTVRWDDGPLAQGPIGRAIRTGASVVAHVEDGAFEPWREAARAAGLGAVVAAPIRKGHGVVGAIGVYADDRRTFDDEFVALLEAVAGDVGFALQTVEDREARRAALDALAASEARFRTIFDQSPIGIAIGSLDGRLERVNPALQRMLGYPERELRGKTFADVSWPPDIERERPLLEALTAGSRDSYTLEKRYVRKDERVIWGEVTVTLIRDERNRIAFGLGLVRDITDSKVLREELLHSQKMEGIGRLAGGIAHDFNNLLTAILGYSEMLTGELGDGHAAQPFVAEIQKAGTRAAALTSQLLAFARKQVVAPRMLNLNEVVADAGRLLQRLVGEQVRIDTVAAPGLWTVQIDANQVQQILVNMVVNARDAMPDGGAIRIETANEIARPVDPVAGTGGSDGEYVRLTIADTGTGMSPEVLEHAFEPFFTTKEQGKGTGLGLATCHGIATQNGGFIRVASTPGQGTIFDVLLPRATGPQVAPPPSGRQQPGEGRGEVVLVAEDEPTVRALACRSLAARGYRVLEAGDGEAALANARDHAPAIHLLVTDVVMPGIGGPALAERLRALCPGIRVLFVSGHGHSSITREGVPDPPVEYLDKPFTPEQIAHRVRQILDAAAAGPGTTG